MITIFFPPGAFGSTIEYCIRRFSLEFETINAEVLPNGSMHSYTKEFHLVTVSDYSSITSEIGIATPAYPALNNISANQSVDEFIKTGIKSVLFITLDDQTMVERNWLFSYHKNGLGGATTKNVECKNWNKNYQGYNDMAVWEQREWLSILINDTLTDYTSVITKSQPEWLCINSEDILYNFRSTILKIFAYFNLQFVDDKLDEFINHWFSKQQYILSEYNTIDLIVKKFLNNEEYCWQPISLMGEAIIQYRLYNLGYKLRCFNLNKFPNSVQELKMYIE